MDDSRVEELERDNQPPVVLDRKDAVVALDPSKRPFAQQCVKAEFGVPADPMLHNVPPGLLFRTTCPIRAEDRDIRDDKTRFWD